MATDPELDGEAIWRLLREFGPESYSLLGALSGWLDGQRMLISNMEAEHSRLKPWQVLARRDLRNEIDRLDKSLRELRVIYSAHAFKRRNEFPLWRPDLGPRAGAL